MPSNYDFTDAESWNYPQYYSTIQLADIDGDGQDELIGRNGTKIAALKFQNSTQTWGDMVGGPPWADSIVNSTDNTNWDNVQYYSTIQTARVKGDPNNPNNPPNSAGKAYAALLGRSFYSMETWRFNNGGQTWDQTSAPFPAFNADHQTAYNYLTQNLPWTGGQSVDLRQRYPFLTNSDISEYQANLPGGQNALPPPSGVSPSDWTTVWKQIYDELTAVDNVNTMRDLITVQLLVNITVNNGTLDQVNQYLKSSVPSVHNDGWTIFVTLIEIVANAVWAVSALAEPELVPALAAVTGLFAAASIGLGLIPDPSASPTYSPNELSNLKADLSAGFAAAASGNNAFAGQVVQNWGLLQVQGEASGFDPSVPGVVDNSYEISAYQSLSRLYWVISALVYSDFSLFYPDVQSPYLYDNGQGMDYYIGAFDEYNYNDACVQEYIKPTTQAMVRLFGPASQGGLNQPIADALLGNFGWQLSNGSINTFSVTYCEDSVGIIAPRPRGPRLAIKAGLARDASGGLRITSALTNEGNRSLTNIELTSMKLGSKLIPLSAHRTRLVHGKSETLHAAFAQPGPAGQKMTLTIRGKYKGGTFGGSFRVTLP